MPGNTKPIEGPQAVRRRRAGLGRSRARVVPGSLTQWADDETQETYWEFVGNGTVTGTDLIETILERESHDPKRELPPEVHSRTFARHAAETVLSRGDSSYNPDAPIPQGQVEEVPLKDVLATVAPYLERFAEAHDRKLAASGQSEGNALTGHGIFGEGLVLPIQDPPEGL